MSNSKRLRWEDEELSAVQVKDDIVCKDCAFRNDGTIWSSHYTKSHCQQFPYPQSKPDGILFDGAGCPKHRKEM